MEENLQEDLLNSFKKKGGFLNKNLIVKKDLVNGFSIFAINDILPNEDLINVPHNLLIPVDKIKNLNKFNNTFEEIFFKTLSENSNYLNTHPLNCNDLELAQISKVIKNNENLYKNFLLKFDKYNFLEEEEKKIELLSATRAIKLKKYKKKFFMPIMDFVNYNYNGLTYLMGESGNVYIKSEKIIKKDDEIYVNYTPSIQEAISFYFEHGFIDKSFNSFKIKKNELKLNLDNISTFNKNYFAKNNNVYTFIQNVDFENNNFSKNFIKLLEIVPSNQRFLMAKKILNMYKNSLSLDTSDNYSKNSIILKNFYESVKLYINIIENYLQLITKSYEKN